MEEKAFENLKGILRRIHEVSFAIRSRNLQKLHFVQPFCLDFLARVGLHSFCV